MFSASRVGLYVVLWTDRYAHNGPCVITSTERARMVHCTKSQNLVWEIGMQYKKLVFGKISCHHNSVQIWNGIIQIVWWFCMETLLTYFSYREFQIWLTASHNANGRTNQNVHFRHCEKETSINVLKSFNSSPDTERCINWKKKTYEISILSPQKRSI